MIGVRFFFRYCELRRKVINLSPDEIDQNITHRGTHYEIQRFVRQNIKKQENISLKGSHTK